MENVQPICCQKLQFGPNLDTQHCFDVIGDVVMGDNIILMICFTVFCAIHCMTSILDTYSLLLFTLILM